MKKLSLILISTITMFCYTQSGISGNKETQSDLKSNGPVSIYCSPDLFNITKSWVEEYNRINPQANIILKEAVIDNINKASASGKTTSFITKFDLNSIDRENSKTLVVGRNVIVPIMNSENPNKEEIIKHGISSKNFASLMHNSMNPDADPIDGIENRSLFHYYMIGDKTIKLSVEKFINANIIPDNAIYLENVADIIEAVQNDPYAFAFLPITEVIDLDNNEIVENISLIPIDKNDNGKIDYFEEIFADVNVLLRGVWIGKYPNELINNIYSVTNQSSDNEISSSFISWILTDGQGLLNDQGYCNLVGSERQSKLSKLNEYIIASDKTERSYAGLKLLFIGLIILAIIALNLEGFRIYKKYRKSNFVSGTLKKIAVFNEDSLKVPQGLFFDKTHTWAFMEKDGLVKIGMDDFLPQVTGNLTSINLKEPGEKVKKGEVILSLIQKGKKLNIKAPVSGTIKEYNRKVLTNASIINSSPYSDAWVYVLEPSNWVREIQFLFMADKFREWLKGEFTRLKDFLAVMQSSNENNKSQVVFQEGGQLKYGVLEDFGPAVWEDFQSNFVETSA